MKTVKLLPIVLLVGACTLSAHAQKQLKYVPQAMKGAKAVPYVVNPKLPMTVRTGFAMPVVRPQAAPTARPNVAAAVERQVAAQITVEERLKRLESNLKKLEEYARTHNNKLPETFPRAEGSNFRNQVLRDIHSLRQRGILTEEHPLVQRYTLLVEVAQNTPTPSELIAKLEKNLNQLEEFALMHDNKLPSTSDFGLRRQVLSDISSLRQRGILTEEHPLLQRYNQLVEADKQQQKEEGQQRKLYQNAQRQKAKLVRIEQREQEKLARAEQREQKKLARAEQQRQEKIARVEQREQKKLAREEQQQLDEQFIQQLRAQEQAEQERAWRQVRLQDKAWKVQPEDIVLDPAENADKAAALGEQQLFVPGTITDDYVEQLLNFYNKLDPLGTGTIQ